jgi:micrococcal nuclease
MVEWINMNKFFWEDYKNFFAIIIAAVIIGAFIYFGIKNGGAPAVSNVAVAPKTAPQNLKINSVAQVPNNPAVCGAAENTIVTKVIDGDTVVVEGGWHVRLLGMDADEKGYPCYDAARIRLEDLVLGKQIVLQKDVSDVDQYGRCLRYIFLGNTNVDTQLVAEGLAVARFYAPDVKYRTEITAAEQNAQQNKIGCKWSGTSQIK